jgi:hypothetical protein
VSQAHAGDGFVVLVPATSADFPACAGPPTGFLTSSGCGVRFGPLVDSGSNTDAFGQTFSEDLFGLDTYVDGVIYLDDGCPAQPTVGFTSTNLAYGSFFSG